MRCVPRVLSSQLKRQSALGWQAQVGYYALSVTVIPHHCAKDQWIGALKIHANLKPLIGRFARRFRKTSILDAFPESAHTIQLRLFAHPHDRALIKKIM